MAESRVSPSWVGEDTCAQAGPGPLAHPRVSMGQGGSAGDSGAGTGWVGAASSEAPPSPHLWGGRAAIETRATSGVCGTQPSAPELRGCTRAPDVSSSSGQRSRRPHRGAWSEAPTPGTRDPRR